MKVAMHIGDAHTRTQAGRKRTHTHRERENEELQFNLKGL